MKGTSPAPSKAVTFMGAAHGSRQEPKAAVELLAHNGKNATILEPTMLSYTDCYLCLTCGKKWHYKVAVLPYGGYDGYGMGCNDPYHLKSTDDPRVSCAR